MRDVLESNTVHCRVVVALEIKPSWGMKLRVTALILSGVFISLLLVYLLSGGGGELFAAKTKLITYMPNSAGLVLRSPVRLNGIEIGRITKVEVSPSSERQRAVRVEFEIKTLFLRSIPKDSEASVRADTLVGDQFLLIKEGKGPVLIAAGEELPFEELNLAIDNADLMRTLQRNLNSVDTILVSLSSKDTQFGQLLLTDDYYKTLLARVSGFTGGLHAILKPQSNLGKAFYTLEAYRVMHSQLSQIDQQLASIQRGEGPYGTIFASDDQYNSLVKSIHDLRVSIADANAGKGPLGPMLKTDDDYKNLQTALRSVDTLIASFNAGERQFGQLLASPQLYESLNGSVKSLAKLAKDVRDNPKRYLRAKIF